VQIVSPSSQPRVLRIRSTSAGVWQRRTSSSLAAEHSTKSKRSCSATMRACDSGCAPVGWSVANWAWLMSSMSRR
jgi:hypothetical protein